MGIWPNVYKEPYILALGRIAVGPAMCGSSQGWLQTRVWGATQGPQHQSTHVLSLNSNWKRLLVILAPLCPENTNILSRHTATGKLQQDGGISPLWATCGSGEAAQPGALTGPGTHTCAYTAVLGLFLFLKFLL